MNDPTKAQIDAALEVLWPTLENVMVFGTRRQYYNREEARDLIRVVLRAALRAEGKP